MVKTKLEDSLSELQALLNGAKDQASTFIRDALLLVKTIQVQVQQEIQPSLKDGKTKLLDTILDASLDGILVVDHSSGKVVQRNDQFLNLWKIPQDLRNSSDDNALIECVLAQLEDPGQFVSLVKHLYENPTKFSDDTLNFKDGRVFDRHSAPIIVDSRIEGRVWFFRDVTEKVRQEKRIEEQKRQMESLIDATPARIFFKGCDDKFILCNRSFAASVGKEKYEIAEINHSENIFGKDVTQKLDILRDDVLYSKKTVSVDLSLPTPDGNRWHTMILFPVIQGSTLLGYGGIITDIHESILLKQKAQEREARIHAIFSQSADPNMTLAPPSWKFTACNSAAVRLFEVESEEEFIRLGPWDVSPEKQPNGELSSKMAPKMIMKAMENGSHFFDWEHRTIKGKQIKCTVLLSRIQSDGETYLQATVRDVTQERDTIEKLRKTKEDLSILREQDELTKAQLKNASDRLTAIYESMQEGLYLIDPSGSAILMNRAALGMLGLSQYDLTNKKIHSLIHGNQRDGSHHSPDECPLYTAMRDGKINSFGEDIFWRKDGTSFPVSFTSTPFTLENNTLGALVTFRDLTDVHELQKTIELERSKAIQTAKLVSLGEMSAGVAHEVNNPLAIISTSLSLLTKFKNDPEKLASKIETLQKATARIEKIIKGLKKFSRSSEGSIRKVERLIEIVNEVLILTEVKAKRHNTTIASSVSDSLFIHCDAVEIEQVLVNLINNAIDAVKESAEKWIKLIAFEQNEFIVIQVIDSGNGISTAIENKLFQPFFTTKPVGEGTGLGLSIAKGIIDNHEATIAVNRSFKNTCFEIRFRKAHGQKNAA